MLREGRRGLASRGISAKPRIVIKSHVLAGRAGELLRGASSAADRKRMDIRARDTVRRVLVRKPSMPRIALDVCRSWASSSQPDGVPSARRPRRARQPRKTRGLRREEVAYWRVSHHPGTNVCSTRGRGRQPVEKVSGSIGYGQAFAVSHAEQRPPPLALAGTARSSCEDPSPTPPLTVKRLLEPSGTTRGVSDSPRAGHLGMGIRVAGLVTRVGNGCRPLLVTSCGVIFTRPLLAGADAGNWELNGKYKPSRRSGQAGT